MKRALSLLLLAALFAPRERRDARDARAALCWLGEGSDPPNPVANSQACSRGLQSWMCDPGRAPHLLETCNTNATWLSSLAESVLSSDSRDNLELLAKERALGDAPLGRFSARFPQVVVWNICSRLMSPVSCQKLLQSPCTPSIAWYARWLHTSTFRTSFS